MAQIQVIVLHLGLGLLLLNSCRGGPCDPDPCKNEGKCRLDSSASSGYVCQCADGSIKKTTCLPPVIQVPDVCVHKFEVKKTGLDNAAEFRMSYNRSVWEKYSYKKDKTCVYTFNFNMNGRKRINVVLDIGSGVSVDGSRCLFDILLYSRSTSGMYLKKLDCSTQGKLNVPWPSEKLVITFPLQTSFSRRYPEIAGSAMVKVGFESCTKCGFNQYGFTDDDFYEFQIPYYSVSSDQCGTVGCLENVLQGYNVSTYYRDSSYSYRSTRCSLTLNVKDNATVCVKREGERYMFYCSNMFSPAVSLYVKGNKYIDFECNDLLQWWCMPWSVGGKQLEFRWTAMSSTYAMYGKGILIVSPSAKLTPRKCGKPEYVSSKKDSSDGSSWTTWSSWTSWSDDDWDSDTYDESEVDSSLLISILIPTAVLLSCCCMGACVSKKKYSPPNRPLYNPRASIDYNRSPETRNPLYSSNSRTHTSIRTTGSSTYRPTAGGSTYTPPTGGTTYTPASAPAPDYHDVVAESEPLDPSAPSAPDYDTEEGGHGKSSLPPPPSYEEAILISGGYNLDTSNNIH